MSPVLEERTAPSVTATVLSGGYAHACSSAADLPPVNPDVPCCDASAFTDMERCTCWVAVYTPEPFAPIVEGPMPARRSMCHDCAYRPGSPERGEQADDPLPATLSRPFTCHQGMPTLRGYTHPELDARGLDGGWCAWAPALHDRDSFDPVRRGGQSWKADGTPADICGGWAAVIARG